MEVLGFESDFKQFVEEFNLKKLGEDDSFLVSIEYSSDNNKSLASHEGMDIALDLNGIIIFCSFLPVSSLCNMGHGWEKAITLLNRPCVGFLQRPFTYDELCEKYQELKRDKRVVNSFSEILFNVEQLNNPFSKINGDSKTSFKDREPVQFSEQTIGKEWLNTVFCDIEGVLLNNNGVELGINQKVLNVLITQEQRQKSIVLWTDDNTNGLAQLLIKHDIYWPVVGKYAFEGCALGMVIAKQSKEHVLNKYGISNIKEYETI